MMEAKPVPSKDKEGQILAAAVPIIGRRGYYGFSIRQVADACQLTVQGVLHYFPSKEALLLGAMDSREEDDFDAIWRDSGILDTKTAAAISLARFRELLHDAVERNSRQPDYLRMFSMLRIEALYPEHPAHEFCQTRARTALDLTTRILTGKVPAPSSTARQVMAVMAGLEELWLECQCNFDLIVEWDHIAARILS